MATKKTSDAFLTIRAVIERANVEIQNAAKVIQTELGKLRINLAIESLRKRGLFRGVEKQELDPKFIKRLNDHDEQKELLAKYLNRPEPIDDGFPSLAWTSDTPQRIFFESGSTVAFVIAKFAENLDNALMYPEVQYGLGQHEIVTNNLFALTALTGLVKRVSPVEGNLLAKYSGFFSSAEKDEAPNSTSSIGWKKEIVGYNRLCEDTEDCTHIFATCSNFSLLAGPLVGSRGNAIAKHAIFSRKNAETKFCVLFHYDKLIRMTDDTRVTENEKKTLDECFCVFHVDKQLADNLVDGIQALKNSQWHGQWIKEKRRESIDAFIDAVEQYHAALKRPGLTRGNWSDEALGKVIIIALPNDNTERAYALIEQECEYFNTHFAEAMEIKYIPRSFDLAYKFKIAELSVQRI